MFVVIEWSVRHQPATVWGSFRQRERERKRERETKREREREKLGRRPMRLTEA